MSRPVSRDITPNSLPALGKLCTYCENIDFRALFESESREYQHHESLDDLFNSAISGCGLCQLFRYSSEIDPHGHYDEVKAGGRIWVKGDTRSFVSVGITSNGEEVPDLDSLDNLLCRINIFVSNGDFKSFEQGTPFREALPQGPHSASDTAFSTISSWLGECCTSHTACERPTALPMPSRVLDLGKITSSERQQIRLIPGEGKRGQWVALSHAWGNSQPLKTTKDTLAVHQAGIEWSELPPTFQDAVVITKKLGFQYLWIDSLCIIQNSTEDWDREAATMASVYGNAAITICAEAAANSQCGIFKSANKRRSFEVRLPANSPQNSFEYDIYFEAEREENDGDFHIGYRAWVLQECLLSPRVIIYAADQVYWSCRTGEKSERGQDPSLELRGIVQLLSDEKSSLFPTTGADNGDGKLTGSLTPTRIEKMPFKQKVYSDYAPQHRDLLSCWYNIVEYYGVCNITKAEDRLPAIAGVAKRIRAITGFSYLAGLWLEDIAQGLCWCYENGLLQTSSLYLGPTWSWVSLTYYSRDKPLSLYYLPRHEDFKVAEHIKIEDINIKYVTADEFMQVQEGSSLRITGLCCDREYTVEPLYYDNDRGLWVIYMSGKPQFKFWETHLDVRGSPADRKLTFLRLGQWVAEYSEVYLLILEKSPGDSEKYVRAGILEVPMETWEQMNLEFWSVQSFTII